MTGLASTAERLRMVKEATEEFLTLCALNGIYAGRPTILVQESEVCDVSSSSDNQTQKPPIAALPVWLQTRYRLDD